MQHADVSIVGKHIPGVLPLISPRKLAKAGLLDSAVVPVMNEIQNYNPLLFDFVLKRQLRVGSQRLPDDIFHTRDFCCGELHERCMGPCLAITHQAHTALATTLDNFIFLSQSAAPISIAFV